MEAPSPTQVMLDVLGEVRRLLARPGNDYSWSSFGDVELALAELDGHIEAIRAGERRTGGLAVLFLPTGPIQEVALSSGWGDEFVAVAERFDRAADLLAGRVVHRCDECGGEAATITAADGVLTRTTFTGTLTQAETSGIGAVIGDAAALHALDPELAPFWCPVCRRTYCGAHWAVRDVFDDEGFHDAIRGTCPAGHERMLED